MPERTIPLDEVKQSEWFSDMAELAEIFNHEIVEDRHGTWRFKGNSLIRLLLDGVRVYTPPSEEAGYSRESKEFKASVCLNNLWIEFMHKRFTLEEMMKFYMGMGYSLSGYAEVFGQREASEFVDDARTEPKHPDQYTQTPIDYIREKYQGQTIHI